jgi:hypothetical protein
MADYVRTVAHTSSVAVSTDAFAKQRKDCLLAALTTSKPDWPLSNENTAAAVYRVHPRHWQ